jgi:hypothetical protein
MIDGELVALTEQIAKRTKPVGAVEGIGLFDF